MRSSTLETISGAGCSPEELRAHHEAAIAALNALRPADAVEAMAAARAVACHHAALECFRRAALPDVSEDMAARLCATAAKMSRHAAELSETLINSKPADETGLPVMPDEEAASAPIQTESAATTESPECPAEPDNVATPRVFTRTSAAPGTLRLTGLTAHFASSREGLRAAVNHPNMLTAGDLAGDAAPRKVGRVTRVRPPRK